MTTIEKIRNEVERLAKRQYGWYILKDDLLAFLDTLENGNNDDHDK